MVSGFCHECGRPVKLPCYWRDIERGIQGMFHQRCVEKFDKRKTKTQESQS